MSQRVLAVSVVACLVCGTAAEAATFVVPNANETVDANSNNSFPFLTNFSFRYQQVYDASQFGALSGPELITGIRFRPDGTNNFSPFSFVISDIEIRLSTTSAAPDGLDPFFANNVGADVTVVHSGPLPLSTANAPGPGDTKVFDVEIPFSQSFPYDPSQGNLLLDVRRVSTDFLSGSLDAATVESDSVSRALTLGDPDATTATSVNTLGLVTQFTTGPIPVPALGPGARVLLALLLASAPLAVSGLRRQRKRA